MIQLSNAHVFEFRAASGALGFDGKGWWWEQLLASAKLINLSGITPVIKTLTLEPRRGNLLLWQSKNAGLQIYQPWNCIKLIPGGVVNAVGLTNPGLEWWCKHVGPKVDRQNLPLMASIYDEKIENLRFMAEALNSFDLVGLELNVSCPNTGGDLLSNSELVVRSCIAVRNATRFPLIVKLNVVHDIASIVPRLEGVVEGIAINSVPWSIIFRNTPSPFAHLGGGSVSGERAQSYTWALVRKLVAITDLPIIGCSVWNYEDIEELWDIGVCAIDFGSIFLKYPWRPGKFIRRDRERRVNAEAMTAIESLRQLP